MSNKGWAIGIILAVLLTAGASAYDDYDQYVINSKDWTDIYSATLYAGLNKIPSNYIIEETRGYLLLETLDSSKRKVLLIESKKSPYIKNFQSDISNKGFDVTKFDDYSNLNIELAEELPNNINKFIVMDKQYSYNSISVAPYAVLEGYYVLFADSDNIDDIVKMLQDRGASDIIIYGYVDRKVASELQRFSPDIIDKGNKYANNIEIIKRFSQKKDFSQYLLTSGDFIEPQFFSGTNPVVLIGKSNVPEITMNFLKATDIKHAILIGNDLVDIALILKQEADMKIMVKFAKGINMQQYSLDSISLPVFDMQPSYRSIQYNPLSKQVAATIANLGSSPAFIRNTYSITFEGEPIAEIGDEEPVFLGAESVVTLLYDADLSNYDEWGMRISARMVFGEEKGALDSLILDTRELISVSYEDNSEIEIKDIYYDKSIKRFVINIKNIGKKRVHLVPYIEDIIINSREQNLGGRADNILPGQEKSIRIRAELTEEDIEDNPQIRVKIQYGEKEDMLIKTRLLDIALVVKSSLHYYYTAAGIALLLLILIIALIIRRRKRKHAHSRQSSHNHAQNKTHHNHHDSSQ